MVRGSQIGGPRDGVWWFAGSRLCNTTVVIFLFYFCEIIKYLNVYSFEINGIFGLLKFYYRERDSTLDICIVKLGEFKKITNLKIPL